MDLDFGIIWKKTSFYAELSKTDLDIWFGGLGGGEKFLITTKICVNYFCFCSYFRISSSHHFSTYANSEATAGLYKGAFVITAVPADTFINMKVRVINSF